MDWRLRTYFSVKLDNIVISHQMNAASSVPEGGKGDRPQLHLVKLPLSLRKCIFWDLGWIEWRARTLYLLRVPKGNGSPVFRSIMSTSQSNMMSSPNGNAFSMYGAKCSTCDVYSAIKYVKWSRGLDHREIVSSERTLCGCTGFRLRDKYLKSDPCLCSCTRSPSYFISAYKPCSYFFTVSSKDLQGLALKIASLVSSSRVRCQHRGENLLASVGWETEASRWRSTSAYPFDFLSYQSGRWHCRYHDSFWKPRRRPDGKHPIWNTCT